ncbi:MAG: ATP-binding protein [Gammaproteobacteria bacterium]
MRLKLGLRSRFLLATLGLAVILVGGFTFAIQQSIEVVEARVMDLQFRHDFDNLVAAVHADASVLPALPVGYHAYLVRNDHYDQAPAALRAVPAGLHQEYPVEGREYALGRADFDDLSFFLLLDSNLQPVEQLEDQLLKIALLVGLGALGIAAFTALWLARVVLRPVHALAANIHGIVPGAPRSRLNEDSGDHEIALIAEAFERTLDRYDQLVERERDFTRDASHELRTPLTVILTSLELIEVEAANLSGSLKARLARIRASAEQMRALTEGLLFLARPQSAQMATTCAVSSVLRDAIRLQCLATSQLASQISLKIDQEVELAVPYGLLLCIVNNLLRNAIEHSGGMRIEVTLLETSLLVEDYGRGIDPSTADGLFGKHARGDDSTGEGLGLYIVKRICDWLAWPITIETAAHGGARFRLEFLPDR